MKSDYSLRTIDNVGRIVIPMDLRRTLDIQDFTELRLYREGNRIIMEKNRPQCSLCRSEENLVPFHKKYICEKCLTELRSKG